MGLDTRAIASQGLWLNPSTDMPNIIASMGYLSEFSVAVSEGGVTDSLGDDLLDSTGDIIYDSLWVSEPGNPLGINSIVTYGYWNVIGSQLNQRVATFGYLGIIAQQLVWLDNIGAKCWVALNSKFKMR